jgi:hypothetical protein
MMIMMSIFGILKETNKNICEEWEMIKYWKYSLLIQIHKYIENS